MLSIILREGGGQMSVGFVFWLLMIIWLILGVVWWRKVPPDTSYVVVGGNVLIFILLCLLGWGVFGFPISG